MNSSDTPLISIVITTLNGGKTLEQCLGSIGNQSFKDYELVIVDGGSSDSTMAIINSHKPLCTKIQVIPKIGLYAGLNAGVRLSSGEWLYFIGCDDRLASDNTLAEVSLYLSNIDKSVKVAAGSVTYADSKYVMPPSFGSPLFMKFILHHQGTFYRREVFEGSYYNEALKISSDYEFNLKLALSHTPYVKMDVTVAIYGEEGVSSRQFKQNFSEIQYVNSRLFTGWKRLWVLYYNWFKINIWILRYKTGLLNLKYRLKFLIN